MPLNDRILLFCLLTVSAAMALSISIVLPSDDRSGLKKWAIALGLEAVAWALFATYGKAPLAISVIGGNFILSVALAVKLVAIHEYRGLAFPRWQCAIPVWINLLVFLLFLHRSPHQQAIAGSCVYAVQMILIIIALGRDTESRVGRAWNLLFSSTLLILTIYLLRAFNLLSSQQFGRSLPISIAPHSIQLIIFLCVLGLFITETMGFILMIKQRSDREFLSLAMTDPLTGIFNRRAFMANADKECSIAQRHGLPLALLMIDVDHFKKINDHYGHPTGDAVLAQIARILTSRLRKEDTIGRYGGEEFCILLPATEENGAMAIGENLRQAIAAAPLTRGKSPVYATVSIGITVQPPSSELYSPDFAKLLAAADAALYQAKHDGRNRVVLINSLRTAITQATDAAPTYTHGFMDQL